MPEQAHHMKSFFSMFYASINGGSLISTILTPILRQNTACFGQDSCYPLAFGVPAALMVVAICKINKLENFQPLSVSQVFQC